MIGYLQDMAAFVHQTYHSQQHLPHPEVLLEQLPEPLFEGNTADKYEKCILEEDFKALENGNNVGLLSCYLVWIGSAAAKPPMPVIEQL